jgi:hypothetical protein
MVKHLHDRKLRGDKLKKLRRLVHSGCNCIEMLGYTVDLDSGDVYDGLKEDKLCSEKDAKVLNVLLAHYAAAEPAERTGKLVKFRDLRGGHSYEESFIKSVTQTVATVFGEIPEALIAAAKLLNGVALTYGDASVEIPVLEIPIVYILWRSDEFAASATALFDESASHYLPTEDLAVLAELTTIRLVHSLDALKRKV